MKTIILLIIVLATAYYLFRSPADPVYPTAIVAQTAGFHEPIQNLADRAVTQLREHRSVFAGVIERFDTEGKTLEKHLEAGKQSLLSFQAAIKESRDRDEEFNKVYATWGEVNKSTILLHQRFRELVTGAEQFYAAVRTRAESIHDEVLRTESLTFIEKSEQAYVLQLKDAREAIQQVDSMKVRVDDVMKALEIRFAIETIDQRLGEMFAEIDLMIESVLSALRSLEKESRSVLRNLAQ
jgi:hypothetical protein